MQLWNAKSLEELYARDMSDMSETSRARVCFMMQQLQVELPVIQWTFYPLGSQPLVQKIRHLPLRIGNKRPYCGFFCQGWAVEGIDASTLRGIVGVNYTSTPIAVYEWLGGPAGANVPGAPRVNDPRGRPLMRNTAATKLWGIVRSDTYYLKFPRAAAVSDSGSDPSIVSNSLPSISITPEGPAKPTRVSSTTDLSTGDDEPADPEWQLGRTFVDQSQVRELVDSLFTFGLWTSDEVAIRVKPRRPGSMVSTTVSGEDEIASRDSDLAADSDPNIKYFSYDARLTQDPVTGNQVVLVNVMDVSERRRMSRMLEKAKHEAEEANKSKSMFLANISHDLRTPMTGVLGVVDLLKGFDNFTSEQRGLVDTLSASAEILLALVNDLLDFSKIEAGQLSLEQVPFSLRKLLADVMDLLRPRAQGKGLKLVVSPELVRRAAPSFHSSGFLTLNRETSEDFCLVDPTGIELKRGDPDWLPNRIVGDSTRLKQILFNLVGNAIKFTEGGKVDVCVTFMPTRDPSRDPGLLSAPIADRPDVDSPSERPDFEGNAEFAFLGHRSSSIDATSLGRGLLRVSVKDSGIGLTEQQIGHLFQPFSQGDSSMTRRFGGTGLGLAISRKLVELMDGEIGVSSSGLSQGAEFWFEVPVMWDEDPEVETIQPIQPLPLEVVCTQDFGKGIRFESSLASECLDGFVSVTPAESAESLGAESFNPIERASSGQVSIPDSVSTAVEPVPARKGVLATIPQYEPRNILLAEDNITNSRLIVRMLERQGHTVTAVMDGQQAVEACRLKAEADFANALAQGLDAESLARNCMIGYDVILMDNNMPVLSGPEATGIIRKFPFEQNPGIPIVALSADAFSESREKSQDSGLDAYVTKPVDWARLSRVMDRVIRAKRNLGASAASQHPCN